MPCHGRAGAALVLGGISLFSGGRSLAEPLLVAGTGLGVVLLGDPVPVSFPALTG